MKLLRVLRWCTAALMTAYLVFSPPLIRRGLARDIMRGWFEYEAPVWEGRIVLWHIAGFKPWQGSVTHHLEERAAVYTKQHRGVHIEVLGLTVEQFKSRLARGAFPDAYSFPTGLLYAEQLQAADYAPVSRLGGIKAATAEGKTLAVPWLMSGYFLAANIQLLSKHRMELPDAPENELLQAALDMEPPQLAIPPVLAARAGLTGEPAGQEAFAGGKCMLAVMDARSLGSLMREAALPMSSMAYAPYTDEVQYIGAARQTDSVRAAIVADFADFLLSDAEQARLSMLGLLPVTATAKPVYAHEAVGRLHSALASPLAPEPFAYERHGQALAEEAIAALTGDGHAKMSFSERMAVVENGELW